MMQRLQQTIERTNTIRGFGLFTNADVSVTFQPAAEGHGIVFQRVDLIGQPLIPANIERIVSEERRSKLLFQGASVEMTEHLLAACAGLEIDNCLVQLDAPELPGCDGSALPYAEALLDAGIVPQTAPKPVVTITQEHQIETGQAVLTAKPDPSNLQISYELNYGPESVIPPQAAEFIITPEIFISKIAPARTFVLEQEISYLRSRGYGQKVTTTDLLVYGPQGPIENELRAWNECARHKLLDCLGDLSLCGCDVRGSIRAIRSGHRDNHQLARMIRDEHLTTTRSIHSAA